MDYRRMQSLRDRLGGREGRWTASVGTKSCRIAVRGCAASVRGMGDGEDANKLAWASQEPNTPPCWGE